MMPPTIDLKIEGGTMRLRLKTHFLAAPFGTGDMSENFYCDQNFNKGTRSHSRGERYDDWSKPGAGDDNEWISVRTSRHRKAPPLEGVTAISPVTPAMSAIGIHQCGLTSQGRWRGGGGI